MKIVSILTPTRERPEKLKNYYNSLVRTIKHPEEVELLLYLDNNDPALHLYEQYFKILKTGKEPLDFRVHVGESLSISKSWNILAEEAQGNVFLMGNDDLEAQTFGWDTRLQEVDKEYPDKVYCAFFDDGINHGTHCAFPSVSRTWYEALGYFTPGHVGFRFAYNDTWVFDIGKRVNRVRYIPEVLIKHVHWTITKQKDSTTKRHRDDVKGQTLLYDKKLFEATSLERQKDAEKLLRIIKRHR